MIILNLLVLAIGIMNYNTVPGQMILTGFTMNAVVISTNGYMPVYNDNVDMKWWRENKDGIHRLNPPNANFPFLGDWWVMPNNLSASPGDIMMFVGAGWLLWEKLKGG